MLKSLSFYFAVILITSVLIETSTHIKRKFINTIFVCLSLSFPAFFSGIRYGIGIDYFNYVSIFNQINNGHAVRTEFSFNAINLIIGKLGGNEQVMFFVVSYLTFLFVYLAIKKYEDTLSLGLCMFVFMLLFYNASFNIVRMILAISIILYSFEFIYEKKLIRFLITVILAISIHKAAIVILPFYFIFNNIGKKNKVFRLMIYIIMITVIFNYDILIRFISMHIFQTNYYLYYIAESGQSRLGIGVLIIHLPFILPGIIFYKELIKKDSRFSLLFFMSIVGFILKFLSYTGATYVSRISHMFFISVVLIVPFYDKLFKQKKHGFIIRLLIIVFVIVYWVYFNTYPGHHGTLPYRTIFF